VGIWWFYRGFLKKRVFVCGFSLVKLWWKRGELWCVDGRVLAAKTMPLFEDLFLGIPILTRVFYLSVVSAG
jgi:hypothetical protein